jgi:hypothetical protein
LPAKVAAAQKDVEAALKKLGLDVANIAKWVMGESLTMLGSPPNGEGIRYVRHAVEPSVPIGPLRPNRNIRQHLRSDVKPP